MTVLRAVGVHKTYGAQRPVHALRGVDLEVEAGERVSVVGRSGSGKSTLLNIVGLLDVPTSGTLELVGRDTRQITGARRDRVRAELLGFVFQDSHVLGHRTVSENLDIKLAIAGVARASRSDRTESVLDRIGLLDRRHTLGRLLSGGERQRLAVARAVITAPRLLLADEPTGNLDEENASNVLALFDEQAAAGVAVVVITHDPRISRWADRSVRMAEGRLHTVDEDR